MEFFFDGSLTRYSFNVSIDKELDESDFTKSFAGGGLKFNLDDKHSFESSSVLDAGFPFQIKLPSIYGL